MRLLAFLLFGWLLAAAGSISAVAAEGAIALTVTPEDAEIWLDGKLVANASPVVLRVEEGRHRVEARKTGYVSQSLDVVVGANSVQSREIHLTHTQPASPKSVDDWLNPPKPIKDAFETAAEFALRQRDFERQKVELLHEFNGFVGRPAFAAGKVILIKEQYDIEAGKWPIAITLMPWASKRISSLTGWESWITLSREDARKLFVVGAEQYVYLTFDDDGKQEGWFLAGGGDRYPIRWRNLEKERLHNLPPPKMAAIPIQLGGFLMGSNDKSDEQPVHRVTIGYSFELSATPITFDQWDACLADGGCDGYKPDDSGWGRGNRPVICVSWDDAQKYIAWLNRKTGKKFRLPTEAEWEYAARAGTTTKYWWGDEIGKNNANCYSCGSQWDHKQAAPVGSFRANPFGLYDMNGNVFQWVADCYADSYQNAPADGSAVQGGSSCNKRVLRGGSWGDSPYYMRSENRVWYSPGARFSGLGFRVARTLTP